MKTPAFSLLLLSLSVSALAQQSWPLDTLDDSRALPVGTAALVPGVEGQALSLDGRSLVELKDSGSLEGGPEGFTFLKPNENRSGQKFQVMLQKEAPVYSPSTLHHLPS